MEGIFEANRILEDLFRRAGVNSIQLGAPSDLDLNQINIYPHLHITLDSSSLTNNSISVGWILTILDVVDKNSGPKDSFGRNDNYEDNFHNLLKIVNQVIRDFQSHPDIHVIELPVANTSIQLTENNCVGWIVELNVTGGNALTTSTRC